MGLSTCHAAPPFAQCVVQAADLECAHRDGKSKTSLGTEAHPSEQGSFWSRRTSSLPQGSPPQLLLLQKPGRRPVFPRKRSQEDSSWIQPQDPSQSSAII